VTDEIITLDEARRRKAEETDADCVVESNDETINRLRRLDPIEYDRVRNVEAEALGIRTTTLDKVVASARGDGGSEDSMFTEITPASSPVNGAEVLDQIATIFGRHLILPTDAADAMAL
jgi:hypothetical protein